jgi:phage anti-repressor protein
MGGQQVLAVDARHLHSFLEIQTQFSHWIQRRIEENNFVENVDFTVAKNDYCEITGKLPTPRIDYFLTLQAAIDIAIVEGTEAGKRFRHQLVDYLLSAQERAQAPAASVEALVSAQIAAAVASMRAEFEARFQAAILEVKLLAKKKGRLVLAMEPDRLIRLDQLAEYLQEHGVPITHAEVFEALEKEIFLVWRKQRIEPARKALGLMIEHQFRMRDEKGEPIMDAYGLPLIERVPMVTAEGQLFFLRFFQARRLSLVK